MKNNPILQMFTKDFKKRKRLSNTISKAENSKRKLEEALCQQIIDELLAYNMPDNERSFLNHKVRGVRIIERLVKYAIEDIGISRGILIDKSLKSFLFLKLNQNNIRTFIDSLNKTFAPVIKINIYEHGYYLKAEFIKDIPPTENL